jgi:type IX secretion system PorP/SprF family membrane protein
MIQGKIAIGIMIFFVSCKYCISQEYAIYERYYFSPFIINPAITGAESYPVADISVRKQWLGFPDAPTTYQLSGNYRIGTYDFYDPKGFVNKGPLKLKDRIGIGAAMYRDVNGPSNFTGGLISYAYHMPINFQTNLSFGMAVVGSYYGFNSSLLKPNQPDDNYLLNDNDHKFDINFNIGGYLYSRTYFIGISANKILPGIYQVNDNSSFNPSYSIIGGYKLMAENSSFSLEPSIAIKKIGSEGFSLDIHSKLYIKRVNWIAVSYETSGNLSFQFGLRLYRKIYVGYDYGYTVSEISRYNYGNHEIHLGINLGLINVEGIRRIAKKEVKK